jgi:ElaA protein
MNWTVKKFNDLTPLEVYSILQLRNEVFVVEQHCVFQDADDKDQLCHHLMGWNGDLLAAYARLVPAGVAYVSFPSIGRVVTSTKARNLGLGKILMQKSIEEVQKLFGDNGIRLGAQRYLQKFYESFGFEQSSEVYIEDGIPHIEMTRAGAADSR